LAQSVEEEHKDVLFFRSNKDPTYVQIVDIAKKPIDWESMAFDGGCPESEDTLSLPKGTYLILHSPAGNTSAFYRVRGQEGKQADNSAFKHGLTMLEQYRLELDRAREALAQSEAVSIRLAEKNDDKDEKIRKLKKKLRKAKDGTFERFVETVTKTVMSNPIVATVVANVIGQCMAAGMPPTDAKSGGNEDGFDYEL
jgi:hypothetical protein